MPLIEDGMTKFWKDYVDYMALKVIMTGLKSLGLYTKFYNIDRSN